MPIGAWPGCWNGGRVVGKSPKNWVTTFPSRGDPNAWGCSGLRGRPKMPPGPWVSRHHPCSHPSSGTAGTPAPSRVLEALLQSLGGWIVLGR